MLLARYFIEFLAKVWDAQLTETDTHFMLDIPVSGKVYRIYLNERGRVDRIGEYEAS